MFPSESVVARIRAKAAEHFRRPAGERGLRAVGAAGGRDRRLQRAGVLPVQRGERARCLHANIRSAFRCRSSASAAEDGDPGQTGPGIVHDRQAEILARRSSSRVRHPAGDGHGGGVQNGREIGACLVGRSLAGDGIGSDRRAGRIRQGNL